MTQTRKALAFAAALALMLPAAALSGCQQQGGNQNVPGNNPDGNYTFTDNDETYDLTPHPFQRDKEEASFSLGTTSLGSNGASVMQESAVAESDEGYADTAAPSSTGQMYAKVASDGISDIDIMPPETEKYAHTDEDGFISVADNPLSTISADVDTASYANLRRLIENGGSTYYYDEDSEQDGTQVIPEDAVRLEEMVNYFPYDYPQPSGTDKFAVASKVGDCPWNGKSKLLSVGFQAGEQDEASNGNNIVLLVDVSGSMSDRDSLPLFQEGFEKATGQFSGKDKISLVTYSGSEQVVLNGTAGNDSKTVIDAIKSLSAAGSTNGEAGLKKAYALAKANYIEGGVNRIIMVSDGDLNVGMDSPDQLKDYVASKRGDGIYLSVLGFGSGNYNDENMEALADNGNGRYHYIDSTDELVDVFSRNLTKNLIPFANDVKLELAFDADAVESYRLIGYENRTMTKEQFDSDSTDAAETGPGDQFTVLYEVVPAKEGSLDHIADLTLKYKPVENFVASEQSVSQKSGIPAAASMPDDDFAFQSAVIEAGQVMGDNPQKGTSSIAHAQETLSKIKLDDAKKKGFAELLDAYGKLAG